MNKIYIAAPLFSESELIFNKRISDLLSSYLDVYLPQQDGDLLVDLVNRGMNEICARKKIFSQDVEAIDRSDFVLAVFDGRSIDEGACFELGYAFAKGKACFGFQTDPRRLLNGGNNPMIDEAVIRTFYSTSELTEWARGTNVVNIG